jgi:hypothetical protein
MASQKRRQRLPAGQVVVHNENGHPMPDGLIGTHPISVDPSAIAATFTNR